MRSFYFRRVFNHNASGIKFSACLVAIGLLLACHLHCSRSVPPSEKTVEAAKEALPEAASSRAGIEPSDFGMALIAAGLAAMAAAMKDSGKKR